MNYEIAFKFPPSVCKQFEKILILLENYIFDI